MVKVVRMHIRNVGVFFAHAQTSVSFVKLIAVYYIIQLTLKGSYTCYDLFIFSTQFVYGHTVWKKITAKLDRQLEWLGCVDLLTV